MTSERPGKSALTRGGPEQLRANLQAHIRRPTADCTAGGTAKAAGTGVFAAVPRRAGAGSGSAGGAVRGALAGLAAEVGAADCKAAGVPKVSAHGMRGLHGTLAVDSGITSHAVASALGHESFKTTAESYAKREAVAGAQQKRALAVLTGGKLAS